MSKVSLSKKMRVAVARRDASGRMQIYVNDRVLLDAIGPVIERHIKEESIKQATRVLKDYKVIL